MKGKYVFVDSNIWIYLYPCAEKRGNFFQLGSLGNLDSV